MTIDAAVMYPTHVPATPAPAASPEAKNETATLYPNLYNEELRGGLNEVADMDGSTMEETEVLRSKLAESFHAVGFSPPEGRRIFESLIKLAREPATAEQRQAWVEESRRELRRQYGSGPDAQQRFAAARALVDRSPALLAALKESGLGSRPDVVMLLAERAYR
jgi:hypothetical protein